MLMALFIMIILTVLFFTLGSVVLKVLYTFCIGLPAAVCIGAFGILFCMTIIGIPIGLLLFKLAGFVLLPFSFHLF